MNKYKKNFLNFIGINFVKVTMKWHIAGSASGIWGEELVRGVGFLYID